MCTEETEFPTARGGDDPRNIPYLSVIIRKVRIPMYSSFFISAAGKRADGAFQSSQGSYVAKQRQAK